MREPHTLLAGEFQIEPTAAAQGAAHGGQHPLGFQTMFQIVRADDGIALTAKLLNLCSKFARRNHDIPVSMFLWWTDMVIVGDVKTDIVDIGTLFLGPDRRIGAASGIKNRGAFRHGLQKCDFAAATQQPLEKIFEREGDGHLLF